MIFYGTDFMVHGIKCESSTVNQYSIIIVSFNIIDCTANYQKETYHLLHIKQCAYEKRFYVDYSA